MNAPKNTRATFSERLARLQVGDTSADLWASYERACLFALTRAEVETDQDVLALPTTMPVDGFDGAQARERERFRAWLAHNLLKCIEDIRIASVVARTPHTTDHVVYVFRGYAQAREYVGRVGGFWPSPALHDCGVAIQNWIEARLRGGAS